MAGYGIQNAVGSAIDNSVKIKKMMDLLPSEEDKAVASATNAEEAARLKEELAKGDADKYSKEVATKYESLLKDRTTVSGKEKSRLLHDPGAYVQAANAKFEKYQQAVEMTSEAHRATIQTKIAALEKAGQRKKTIFERLRGGFRDGK